jgi:hypothetical protein
VDDDNRQKIEGSAQNSPQQGTAIHFSDIREQNQETRASLAYSCYYYIASIGYTLVATNMAVTQCDAIQSPVMCAALNKMGINRNVAGKIVFCPKNLGGLEMHNLYTIQGTTSLQYFIGHLMCKDGNGNLMRICMESTQLEVGSYELFLIIAYKMAGAPLLNHT